jgi:hypothetical protein
MNAVVGVFANHSFAENAVKELDRAGVDMKSLSIVGKDYHSEENVVGYYNTGDRMKYWGKMGVFWGSMWGLLLGSAFFWIPGIGPLLVGGPLVSTIVGAVEGAAVGGGLSALGAALYSIGIPKDSVLRYETALQADSFLVIVHGDAADVERARGVLAEQEALAARQAPPPPVPTTQATPHMAS